MDGNFFVYLLINESSRRYLGITQDVERRLIDHNEGKSRWTASRRPWKILWTSRPLTHGDALRLEKLMKKQKGGSGLDPLMKEYGVFKPGS